MSGLFRSSFSVVTPIPPETLIALLQHRLAPSKGWSDWLARPFTHPFEGTVTKDGFDLRTYYAKLRPRVRGAFVPQGEGTRIAVDVTTVGPADCVMYGLLLSVIGIPLAVPLAYGLWLLSIGHHLWALFVFGPLALLTVVLGLILGSITIASVMALDWTKRRLTEWLTDVSGLHAVSCQRG
ncbi:MAG: hypothetical protein JNM56_10730 [Planctomycetia bacterium]|nr:hypothetical protein [Planctomycetia bacterium]